MKNTAKRMFSLALVLVLLLGSVPVYAAAEAQDIRIVVDVKVYSAPGANSPRADIVTYLHRCAK